MQQMVITALQTTASNDMEVQAHTQCLVSANSSDCTMNTKGQNGMIGSAHEHELTSSTDSQVG